MTLNYSSKWFENVFGYMVINPLETRILDLRPKEDKVLFGSVPNAVLITAQTKTGEGAPFFDIGPSCISVSMTGVPRETRLLPSWSPLLKCWLG